MAGRYEARYIYHDTYSENQESIYENGFMAYKADDETYDGELAKGDPLVVFFCSTLYLRSVFPDTTQYPRNLKDGRVFRFVIDIHKLNLHQDYYMFQVKTPTPTDKCLQVHVLFVKIDTLEEKIKHYREIFKQVSIEQYEFLQYNSQERKWYQIHKKDGKFVYVNLCISSNIDASLINFSYDMTKGDESIVSEEYKEVKRQIESSYGTEAVTLGDKIDSIIDQINEKRRQRCYLVQNGKDTENIDKEIEEITAKHRALHMEREKHARRVDKYRYDGND
ncbi:hypothetical protein ACTFIW_001118 [Dictyostelium discoideum]